MKEKNDAQSWNMDKAIQYIYINEVIFVTLVLLCFIGELLAEVTDRAALFYWFCITPVFFCCSLLSEKAKTTSTGIKKEHLIRYELYIWGSAMTAVMLVFMMWHTESINPGAASMSIHIILAHTLILSGMILGFRYFLVGAFLFLTAALSILKGGTFGLDLVLLLPVIWLGFYMEKTYWFPTLKRNHDFTNDLNKHSDKQEPKK